MSTTIRISNEDKTKLEKLQAEIFLSTGKRFTYTELLHLLIELRKTPLFREIINDATDQTIDWDYILDSVRDLGDTDVSDIDQVVYGE